MDKFIFLQQFAQCVTWRLFYYVSYTVISLQRLSPRPFLFRNVNADWLLQWRCRNKRLWLTLLISTAEHVDHENKEGKRWNTSLLNADVTN